MDVGQDVLVEEEQGRSGADGTVEEILREDEMGRSGHVDEVAGGEEVDAFDLGADVSAEHLCVPGEPGAAGDGLSLDGGLAHHICDFPYGLGVVLWQDEFDAGRAVDEFLVFLGVDLADLSVVLRDQEVVGSL